MPIPIRNLPPDAQRTVALLDEKLGNGDGHLDPEEEELASRIDCRHGNNDGYLDDHEIAAAIAQRTLDDTGVDVFVKLDPYLRGMGGMSQLEARTVRCGHYEESDGVPIDVTIGGAFHEAGHVHFGHNYQTNDQKQFADEQQADWFEGYMLYKAGRSLDASEALYRQLGDSDPRHGRADDRIAALRRGYQAASSGEPLPPGRAWEIRARNGRGTHS